jgi:hypothetical protein
MHLQTDSFELRAKQSVYPGHDADVSLTGLSWHGAPLDPLPATLEIKMSDNRVPLTCQAVEIDGRLYSDCDIYTRIQFNGFFVYTFY